MGGRASGRLVTSRAVAAIGSGSGDEKKDGPLMRRLLGTAPTTDEDDEITVVWGELLHASVCTPHAPISTLSHTHASRPFEADLNVVGMNAVSVAYSLLVCLREAPGVRAVAAGSEECQGVVGQRPMRWPLMKAVPPASRPRGRRC